MLRNRFWMKAIYAGLALVVAFGLWGVAAPALAQGPTANPLAPIARELAQAAIDATVKATGMTERDLLIEVYSGKSLNQIVKEKGKDPATVQADAKVAVNKAIDDAVAANKLTQAQAAGLRLLVDPALSRIFQGGTNLNPAGGAGVQILAGLDVARIALKAVVDATKMTQADVLKAMAGGKKTLQDVLTDAKADVNAVKDQIKKAATDDLNKAVTDKKITQAEADTLLANLDATITKVLTSPLPASLANPVTPQMRLVQARAVGLLVEETANQTKLSQREILAKLRDGKTLNEIVTEAKGDSKAIVDATIKTMTTQINQLVSRKRLTEDEGKALIDQLPDSLTKLMDQKNPLTSTAGRN